MRLKGFWMAVVLAAMAVMLPASPAIAARSGDYTYQIEGRPAAATITKYNLK